MVVVERREAHELVGHDLGHAERAGADDLGDALDLPALQRLAAQHVAARVGELAQKVRARGGNADAHGGGVDDLDALQVFGLA